jgi:hypothetical protein
MLKARLICTYASSAFDLPGTLSELPLVRSPSPDVLSPES